MPHLPQNRFVKGIPTTLGIAVVQIRNPSQKCYNFLHLTSEHACWRCRGTRSAFEPNLFLSDGAPRPRNISCFFFFTIFFNKNAWTMAFFVGVHFPLKKKKSSRSQSGCWVWYGAHLVLVMSLRKWSYYSSNEEPQKKGGAPFRLS